MKMLVVVPAYEPAFRIGGGVVRSMSTLCRAMAKLGVSVTVYTTDVTGSREFGDIHLGRPMDVGGVQVYYFRSTFGPESMFYSRDLVHRMRQTVTEFDVVYIAAWFMLTGIEAAAVCRRNKVPVIAGIHGGFTHQARRKSWLKKALFRELFIKKALAGVAAVRLTSRTEQLNSVDWLDGRPAIIVPNPVDPGSSRPCHDKRGQFRSRYNIPSDARVLVTATRFDWMKRLDLLVDTVAKLSQWYLVIIGDFTTGTGPELRRYASSTGVGDRIVWTGYLEREDLCVALSASDIFALVSETENFGNAAVEAMMCGLPVLVSKETGLWEFIKDQPSAMAPELSVDSIVESLLSFERDTAKSPFDPAQIRQAAMDRFSPPAIAGQFVKEIDKVLSGHVSC